MTIQITSKNKCYDGWVTQFTHDSDTLSCKMHCSVFVPPNIDKDQPAPVLYWLSGLTCTHENFIQKANAQKIAADLGIILVAPDTSPRGDNIPDDPEGAYDLGLGAGFYVNATQDPWKKHYQMYDYIVNELPKIIEAEFPTSEKKSISGHSMGGHGALIIALKNPSAYQSVSAFSPIANPVNCPWGKKALGAYLGSNEENWKDYDATLLIKSGKKLPPALVDQGLDDQFYPDQLRTQELQSACEETNQEINIRLQQGYDHSYYFISSFIEDHLNFHAKHLF